jgi:serine/threonine-protein kinase
MRLAFVALLLIGCGGSMGGGDDGDDIVGDDDGPADPGSGVYFPDGSVYYEDITDVTPVSNSADITAYMEATHGPNGWGYGEMRIDFAILVNAAPAGTMKYDYAMDPDFFYEGECDTATMPLPPGGAVEVDWENPPTLSGLAGYDCTTFDDGGDCHILVHAPDENRLYEVYHGTVRSDGSFITGCLAIWDTSQPATADGRGQQCTSADAAGYAIAPLLVTADEIAAGEITHAVRLILPNDIIRGGTYFPPATHGTDSSGPDPDSLPYGGRMRLRADYPVEDLDPAAQVVARAMQKYGLMLADGGNIALTMSSDALTEHKWDEVGLYPDSLTALKASDFDVIIQGNAIETGATECTHTVITN